MTLGLKININFKKSHKSMRFLHLLLIISDAKQTSWKNTAFFIKEKALKSRYGSCSSPGRTTGALPATSRPKIAMSTLNLIDKIIENEKRNTKHETKYMKNEKTKHKTRRNKT